MALKYKESKIMSGNISIEVGITDGNIDISKSSVRFNNFRNLLSEGVISLNTTALQMEDIPEANALALFQALVDIYESDSHISKLKLDSKLQDAEIVKE